MPQILPRPARLLPVLATALGLLPGSLSAQEEGFACAYGQVCQPGGTVCAPHETELALVPPRQTVGLNGNGGGGGDSLDPDGDADAVDTGTDNYGGLDTDDGPDNDNNRNYGTNQRGMVVWGTRLIEVIEPEADLSDSTRAFESLGNDDYIVTIAPDGRSEVLFFIDDELVSVLDGNCAWDDGGPDLVQTY